MNKFRYVTRANGGKPVLINIEHIVRVDEEDQQICMSDGAWITLKYADIWQLVEDLKNLEVGE